jgi:hypothetical protein
MSLQRRQWYENLKRRNFLTEVPSDNYNPKVTPKQSPWPRVTDGNGGDDGGDDDGGEDDCVEPWCGWSQEEQEKILDTIIWWLIGLRHPWLNNDWLGRKFAGLPEPPDDDCRADPTCFQEYLDSMWEWLEETLGDTATEYWDEFQDWLEDNPSGNFFDWIQEQDWWPF